MLNRYKIVPNKDSKDLKMTTVAVQKPVKRHASDTKMEIKRYM